MQYTRLLVTLIAVFLSGCSPPKGNDLDLAKEFVHLNRANSFDQLFGLHIEPRSSEYDSETKKYQLFVYYVSVYDTSKKTYVKIPVFRDGATENEIEKSFQDCNEDCQMILQKKYGKVESQTPIDVYVSYVNTIRSSYNSIALPDDYGYSNVLRVSGRSSSISFKLTSEIEVTYLTKVDSIKSQDLTGFTKLDESWYYRTLIPGDAL
jgi:hypothetical protein